jgi:hypothetical protein
MKGQFFLSILSKYIALSGDPKLYCAYYVQALQSFALFVLCPNCTMYVHIDLIITVSFLASLHRLPYCINIFTSLSIYSATS